MHFNPSLNLSNNLLEILLRRLSHGLIKALKKFQVRVAGCHQFLPPGKEKINFAPGKYFCSVSGLYMRSLHYAILFFSGVVDIIKDLRHQLIINKAANSSRAPTE